MRAAAALLCLAITQATLPPRDGAPVAPKTGTGVITGRVLAGTTDAGVAGATVYCWFREARVDLMLKKAAGY